MSGLRIAVLATVATVALAGCGGQRTAPVKSSDHSAATASCLKLALEYSGFGDCASLQTAPTPGNPASLGFMQTSTVSSVTCTKNLGANQYLCDADGSYYNVLFDGTNLSYQPTQ